VHVSVNRVAPAKFVAVMVVAEAAASALANKMLVKMVCAFVSPVAMARPVGTTVAAERIAGFAKVRKMLALITNVSASPCAMG
jgi:hypothetical protein